MGKNDVYLTRQGYEKLSEDLDYLRKVRRKKLSKAIEQARLQGDLSENAEYEAAKEAQALNERKIAELEDKLSRVRIIDDENIACDEIRIGASVTLKDLDTNDEFSYTLVSEEEANYEQNKISITSPVGKALLGHKEGKTVKIEAQARTLHYEIIKIQR